MEKKTPLYDAHVEAGGKIVPFAGYLLPVQYKTGVIREHMAVRTDAGLFDVSHMGEVLCQGKDALANLQMLLTNDFEGMADGQARYSPMCVELYTASENAAALWKLLLETGEADGLIPCGLGARDTLRMEAGMPLYGHEMNDDITPLETGLRFAVKLKKEDFIGKKAMEEKGTSIKRIGLKVTGRGIVREEMSVSKDGKTIGHTTSGTHCPFLGQAVAMALVDQGSCDIGDKLQVEVRGRQVEVEVIPLPFYKREK